MIAGLIRENIKNLKPYTSARDLYSGGLLLDANENSFGSVVSRDGLALNRYPDPHQKRLRQAVSLLTGVPENLLFFGVGSDEIIDLLLRIFCEPGRDKVIVFEPTYGMYRVAADINNVTVVELALSPDFQPQAELLRTDEAAGAKLLFLCSPNNPTGNVIDKKTMKTICKDFSGIVVVDEAYIDFAPEGSSIIDEVGNIPNLVVLRTFSKAWGLAGIRAGYCAASELVTGTMFKVKAPYTMNVLTEAVVLEAVAKAAAVQVTIAAICKERRRMEKALAGVIPGITVFPSDANFVLVRFNSAAIVQQRLAEKGIIIRDRSSQKGLADCLRITIGTEEENSILLQALAGGIKELAK
ncbi:MAG: histidinol-phosphate transaminase [Ignavibacteriales bacterium]|nr:histidinol-phosphate transaminase [Ignavibacteriales bacterium]